MRQLLLIFIIICSSISTAKESEDGAEDFSDMLNPSELRDFERIYRTVICEEYGEHAEELAEMMQDGSSRAEVMWRAFALAEGNFERNLNEARKKSEGVVSENLFQHERVIKSLKKPSVPNLNEEIMRRILVDNVFKYKRESLRGKRLQAIADARDESFNYCFTRLQLPRP
ncbi:MAG: hypothetical protein CMK41_04965 [Porticoccaceae bacterium]|nr:hypothetical protein [Porticoccaceae bacterium]|tara:strand:+ start:700 stop:1212 length:513 start_codon:yes stop_codon:yes gene_type:complete